MGERMDERLDKPVMQERSHRGEEGERGRVKALSYWVSVSQAHALRRALDGVKQPPWTPPTRCQKPDLSPSCNNLKCFQTLPGGLWGHNYAALRNCPVQERAWVGASLG